jgi:integrase
VPIDTILLRELAEHRQRVCSSEFVFPSWDRDGKVVPLQDVKVGFGIARRDAGISNFRFHDLRHYAESRTMPNAPTVGAAKHVSSSKQ